MVSFNRVRAYCPKCGSRLYEIDESYMQEFGKCSYCVTNDVVLRKKKEESQKKQKTYLSFFDKEV